ncbi:MAG: coproporphyrinogen-III oxidase family protein [Planctomycetota bacterium]|nr:coproporphyrinogen-III oxidase family protein [Planctomycetota bacterium]
MATESKKTEVGSYFISNYPPFSQWGREHVGEVEAAMQQEPTDLPLGLYLHIPFCRKRCKFCYFKVFTEKSSREIETYLGALCREIQILSTLPVMQQRPFRFVYFGGGTPSMLSSRQLTHLVDRLREYIGWEQAEEVTFECEPGTLSASKIQTLKDLGVTRLSLGIENFDDHILKENGRAHLAKEVYKAWDWIEKANFDSVNIDLIAGMVGETKNNWTHCIEKTLALSPDSVTIYQMELPFNTVYSKDMVDTGSNVGVADWVQKRKWVAEAFSALESAGYAVSSGYTLVRDPEKVKFSYRDHLWRGSDLVASGIASFGHLSGVHYQNKPEWSDYVGDLELGKLPLGRALRPTPHQSLIREMILQLKKGRIDTSYFKQKFATDILAEWESVWAQYRDDGYLSIDGSEVILSREGLLRIDGLLPAFFEVEHQGIRYT